MDAGGGQVGWSPPDCPASPDPMPQNANGRVPHPEDAARGGELGRVRRRTAPQQPDAVGHRRGDHGVAGLLGLHGVRRPTPPWSHRSATRSATRSGCRVALSGVVLAPVRHAMPQLRDVVPTVGVLLVGHWRLRSTVRGRHPSGRRHPCTHAPERHTAQAAGQYRSAHCGATPAKT